jgi:hypothetical protein
MEITETPRSTALSSALDRATAEPSIATVPNRPSLNPRAAITAFEKNKLLADALG